MERTFYLKILLVDDDPIFCQLTKALIFQHLRVQPRTACDGLEAEKILQDWRPDVVITDTNMPRKNGVELIQSIRSKYATMVIVSLFSGLVESSITAQDLQALGAHLVLHKKEILSQLLPALEELSEKLKNLAFY